MKRYIAMLLVVILSFTPIYNAFANKIILPADLEIIDKEAFMGTTAFTEGFLPYGIKEIRSKAFADSSIQKIYIPDTVEFIEDDAFENAEDIIIYAPINSYAEEYAVNHDYLWQDAGNRYKIDQFKAKQEIYENLEYGEEGMVELEKHLNLELIDTEGITDNDLLNELELYNDMQKETTELLNEYTHTYTNMLNACLELENSLQDSSVEFTEDGMVYSDSDFSYFVSSEGAEDLDNDYDIISVTPSEDGEKIEFEILSGGKTVIIESSTEGITLNERKTSFQVRFQGETLISYSAKETTNPTNEQQLLSKVQAFSNEMKEKYNLIEREIKTLHDFAKGMLEKKQAKLDLIRDLLNNPGEMSEEIYRRLQADFAIAEFDYDCVLKTVHALDKAIAVMKTINPVFTIGSIVDDIQKWNELGKIYEHGHPLPNEMSNKDLIQQMLNDCRTARTAYVCNAVNSLLALVDEISTVVALVGSLTGAGVPVAWLQKAAVFVGLKGTRAILMNACAGVVLGVTAGIKYENVMAADKKLHGGITGTITNILTGEPVKRAEITCAGMTAYTDSKGKYQINPPDGEQKLIVKKQGYAVQEEQVTVSGIDQMVKKDIKMKPIVSISGVIRDSETGQVLSGVSILTSDQQVINQPDGSYSISFPYETKILTFSKEGYDSHTYMLMPELLQEMNIVYDVSMKPKAQEPTPTPTPVPSSTSSVTPEPSPEPTESVEPTYEPEDTPIPPDSPAADFEYYIEDEEVTITAYIGEGTWNPDCFVVIPSTIEEYPVTKIGEEAFFGMCASSLIIPDTVTEIGDYAFSHCWNLKTIRIPNSITIWGENTFSNCDNLETVQLESDLKEIGNNAFDGCEKLKSVAMPKEGLEDIGSGAFRDCTSLTSIGIPKSVRNIYAGAFANCENLKLVTFSDKGSCNIWTWAFQGCTSLESVVLTASQVGNLAFQDCTNLKHVRFVRSVSIYGHAFIGCSSLESVSFDHIELIESDVFRDCYSLKTITIDGKINETNLEPYAFGPNLQTVVLYDSYWKTLEYLKIYYPTATIVKR